MEKYYSETGNFSAEEEKVAKRIKRDIAKLRKLGCVVLGKADHLVAYRKEDYNYSTLDCTRDYYPLKSLDLGDINDSGADDEEKFEDGYIIGD